MASNDQGQVLDESFRLFRQTVLPNLPLSALMVLGAQAPNMYRLTHAGRDAWWWLLLVGGLVVSLYGYAALVLRQRAALQGNTLALGVALAAALARLGRLLQLAVISVALIAAGLVLLLVPGLLAMLVTLLAPVALVTRGDAPLQALRKAWALLRGHIGRSVATFAMALAIFVVFYIVFAALAIMIGRGLGGAGQLFEREAVSYAGYLAQALFAPLLTATVVSLYERLAGAHDSSSSRSD